MDVEMKMIRTADAAEDAFLIRREVFMEEQGFQNEFDETDQRCRHIVAYQEGVPVACGRTFLKRDGVYTIGRVAVRRAYRGKHLGEAVMRFTEEKVRELGGREIELSAQCRAEGFYRKLGYTPEGEIYQDEFCPHITMRKKL